METIISYLEKPYRIFLINNTVKNPSHTVTDTLTAINVFEVMTMNIKIAFFVGLVVSVPYIIYEVWRFVRPALYKTERILIGSLSLFSLFLFYAGIVFGYFLIIPFFFQSAIAWASQYAHVMLTYQSYFNTLIIMVLIFGIIFEVPVIFSLLCLSGVINSEALARNRRFAFLFSFILGALLAPPDVLSMCLIALPLYGMIEVSIILMRYLESRKQLTPNI